MLVRLLLVAGSLVSACGGRATSTQPQEDPGPVELPNTGGGSSGGSGSATGGTGTAGALPVDPEAQCSKDGETGLLWEVRSTDADSFRYEGFTYSWFNSELEGIDAGAPDNGMCGFPPCNTEQYVLGVNQLSLCGHSDWRLPELEELLLLAELEGEDPTGMLQGDDPLFWSNSETEDDEAAWGAYLCCGGVAAPGQKSGAAFVRLVRGPD